MNLGERDNSLSFSFLPNNQPANITVIRIKAYRDMAKEKSMLIIFLGQVYFYDLPIIWDEPHLLYEKVSADIAHAYQVGFQIA